MERPLTTKNNNFPFSLLHPSSKNSKASLTIGNLLCDFGVIDGESAEEIAESLGEEKADDWLKDELLNKWGSMA